MKEIIIKKEYAVRGVGVETKLFETLCNRFDDIEEDILLDFTGLKVTTPWLNEYFCELMSNEHIHIRVSEDETFSRNVETMLRLMGCKKLNRIENIYTVEIKVDEAKERKVAHYNSIFDKSLVLEGDKLIIRLKLAGLTQLGSKETIEFLDEYIKDYCNDNKNIKIVELDVTGLIIVQNVYVAIANFLNSSYFIDRDIKTVERDDLNKKNLEKIKNHRIMKAGEVLPVDSKISILKNFGIKEGTVVILSLFKKTRCTNEFGQMNDGVSHISRFAIFKGYKKEYGNEAILSFRSYKKDTFRTREDYSLNNDLRDTLYEMLYQDFDFKVSEIGFMDKFTGLRAHFNLPVQYDDSGYLYSAIVNEETGSVTSKKFTLPQYAKHVLDRWEIEYNKDSLDFCISESDRLIKEFENNKNKVD